MASSTIRKAIGVVKDQTSISIAKVAGNVSPHLEVLILKATTHDNEPPDDKYITEILNITSYSTTYVLACVYTLSKRLSKTRDWIVALKVLMVIHRLLVDGHPAFCHEIMCGSRKGTRVLNMSGFHDEAHSNSWDHSGFVKNYAMFLDQKIEFIAFEKKDGMGNFKSRSYDDLNVMVTRFNIKDAKVVMENVLGRLNNLLRLVDRILSCKPTGNAKNNRLVIIALYLVLKESFKVYADMCNTMGFLLDGFSELKYDFGVKVFDALVYAAKMSDELVSYYDWCKDIGVGRSSEFPKVQKIDDEILGGLERILREKKNVPNFEESNESDRLDSGSETLPDVNEIKALPSPESHNQPPPAATYVTPLPVEDLLNLNEAAAAMSADAHSNNLAIALFSAPPNVNTNGSWEVFSSSGEQKVTSAWQTPLTESGNADWELALVESASNLSKQKADMGGGLDSLVLNGMYDQGTVRQHISNNQLGGGSSSSVVMPAKQPVLALPAPDGTKQSVGQHDPFAASLMVPPPSYVQLADMEKKQNLLVQEQQVWHQYGSNGMQGPGALARINADSYTGIGQQTGYYYYA